MFALSPWAMPHAVSAAFLLALALYSVRQKSTPLAIPFSALVFCSALWCAIYALEISSIPFEAKLFWAKARFLGLAPLSTLWLVVALHHSGVARRLRWPWKLALAVVPTLTMALSFTSSWHELFRYGYAERAVGDLRLVTYENGPFFWFYALYSYLMSIATGIALYKAFKKRNAVRRAQSSLITAAIMLFIAVDILFQLGVTPVKGYTLGPVALAFSGALMAIAVFRYRILDFGPVTRRMVMDGIADGVVVADDEGRLIEVNKAAKALLGPGVREGMEARALPSTFAALLPPRAECRPWSGDVELGLGEELREFEATTEPVRFGAKLAVGSLLQLRDVTERRRLEREIERRNEELSEKIRMIEALQAELSEQAIRDPLTGLYNRRYMEPAIERDLSLSRRSGLPISFAMLDLDHFKLVNDRWGHQAGDKVLVALARLLLTKLRRSDIASRYGGEEFLVSLPGTSERAAAELMDALRVEFASLAIAHSGYELKATFSAGIASRETGASDADELIEHADKALYRAKEGGRDRIALASERS
jgi:diguanylate cyclase (GGDEF)-like protein